MNFNPLIVNECLAKVEFTINGGKANEAIATDQLLTISCIPGIFVGLVTLALVFSGLVAVVLIIFGGIKFITSQGDEKAVDSGKKTITWAIIGLILILMSFAILRYVSQITGISCINRFGFNQCSDERRTRPLDGGV